jgi:hypothetical protein
MRKSLCEPSMGTSHRLPNHYRGNEYANWYPSNTCINRISKVTNNRNNTSIVASGVYTWVHLKTSTEIYVVESSVRQLDDSDQLARGVRAVQFAWHVLGVAI